MFTEKEENGNSSNGFYRHKETGAVVELVNDPELGTPLTNAFIRAGFVFVGTEDPRIAQAEAKAEAEKAELERKKEEAEELKLKKEKEAEEKAEKKRLAEENAKLKKELEASKKAL